MQVEILFSLCTAINLTPNIAKADINEITKGLIDSTGLAKKQCGSCKNRR